MSFYAYYRIGENRYRERFGFDFEDFAPGQRFRHRPGVTVSQQDNVDEALDTLNAAMLHYDAKYASQTTWKRELVVSTITLQRLIGMSSKTFGRKHALTGFDEIAMTSPVFAGDTLYAESEIVATAPTPDPALGEVNVCCRGFNQDSKEIARITYRVQVWRRSHHPEDRNDDDAAAPSEEPRFLAHRRETDGALTEQVGLFFEDCHAGETFIHWPRRTMLRDEGLEHAWRSLELAPQYHDLDWVAKYGGGEFRFTESWILAAATAMTTRTFGRVVANLGWTDIRFGAAVAPGDTMESQSTILDARESKSRPNEGILGVETWANNQRGELVMSYQRRLLVYKRDADTPYESAGY
ncbi:MAG: MaoC family dehydratase [Gammaproteobacteria bacterium]|jgi:itaconyl-CoA hydratase|nr:MaoC family dehydratase [Gammaproteobacteria bacterium]